MREFRANDLVLKRVDGLRKEVSERKMAPNWEEPYRVKESLGNGVYRLQFIGGEYLPKT